MALYRLMNHAVIAQLGPPLRQGKESVVLHALAHDGRELAVKVHTAKVFGNRERRQYIFGDWRFRHAKRHITLRTEAMWAEKEYRNLSRLEKAGIPAPHAVSFEENIVVMSLIGNGGVAAPQLNEVGSDVDFDRLSKDVLKDLECLIDRARLVHGDLSPYNILVWKGRPYLIDLSQAVLVDHPEAPRLWHSDIEKIAVFFASHDVNVAELYNLRERLADEARKQGVGGTHSVGFPNGR